MTAGTVYSQSMLLACDDRRWTVRYSGFSHDTTTLLLDYNTLDVEDVLDGTGCCL